MSVLLRHSFAVCAFVAALLASTHSRADYTVTKTTTNSTTICRTREIAWRITVSRVGGLIPAGTNRSVSDPIPAGLTYVPGSGVPTPSISGTTLTWAIGMGDLNANGVSKTFDFRTTFVAPTLDVTNIATFNYYIAGLLQAGVTGSSRVTCAPILAVVREAPRCAPPGSVVAVTLRVSAAQLANGAVLIESPPAGVTGITPANGGVYNAGANTITWSIGSISAGATANVSYTFVAPTGPVTTGTAEAYAANAVATFAAPTAITGIVCNDGNVCTTDSCNTNGVCVTAPAAGACNDGNACTTGDQCSAGVCGGAPRVCNDGNACTNDGCDVALGCVTTNNTAPCSDGDVCTNADHCAGGACVSGSPIVCDDGNACTNDACNPLSGCFATNNTLACNDANACTTGDTCSAGACVGAPRVCDDGNGCTNDGCDAALGCVTAANTAPCSDDDVCTSADTCAAGACVSGPAIVCNDGEVCTDDACDPQSGCFTTNNIAACDDGDACTSNDHCALGACDGAAITCNDGDVCTDDSCDPAIGCVTTNNVQTCDDDDSCTSNDLCGGGACGGTGPDCAREVTYGEVRLDDGTLRTFRCWRSAGVVDCETEPDSRRLVLFEGGMCSP